MGLGKYAEAEGFTKGYPNINVEAAGAASGCGTLAAEAGTNSGSTCMHSLQLRLHKINGCTVTNIYNFFFLGEGKAIWAPLKLVYIFFSQLIS